MKLINKLWDYVYNQNYFFFLLVSTLLVVGLEILYFIIGFILAIPTDYGRLFVIFMSSITLTFYVYISISIPLIKILYWLRRFRTIILKKYSLY